MTYDLLYEPARGPAMGPQPGLMALRDVCEDVFELGDDGIYNPRRIRVRTVTKDTPWSLHAEGRAWDAHVDVRARGDRFAAWLVAHAAELGVQEVIWWHRIWSCRHPAWRAYTGADPHTGHVHVGLVWAAARGSQALTVATVRALADQPTPPTPPQLSPPAVTPFPEEAMRRIDLDIPTDGAGGWRDVEVPVGQVVSVVLNASDPERPPGHRAVAVGRLGMDGDTTRITVAGQVPVGAVRVAVWVAG